MVVEISLRVRFASDLVSQRFSHHLVTLEMPLQAAPEPDADTPSRKAVRSLGRARRIRPESQDLYQAQATVVVVGVEETGGDDSDSASGGVDSVPGGFTTVVALGAGVLVLGAVVGCVINSRRSRKRNQFMMESVGSVALESPTMDSSANLRSLGTFGSTDALSPPRHSTCETNGLREGGESDQ